MVGHESLVTCMRFLDDLLLSSSEDGEIKVWNLKGAKEKLSINPYQAVFPKKISIYQIAFIQPDLYIVCPNTNEYLVLDIDGKTRQKTKVYLI
jgi:WD40 repeat protein